MPTTLPLPFRPWISSPPAYLAANEDQLIASAAAHRPPRPRVHRLRLPQAWPTACLIRGPLARLNNLHAEPLPGVSYPTKRARSRGCSPSRFKFPIPEKCVYQKDNHKHVFIHDFGDTKCPAPCIMTRWHGPSSMFSAQPCSTGPRLGIRIGLDSKTWSPPGP